MELREWLDSNLIDYSLKHPCLEIKGFGKCLVAKTKRQQFHKDGFLHLEEEELNAFDDIKPDYVVYQFGNKWYYTDTGECDLKELKYVGQSITVMGIRNVPFVGIHGGYDLCNGSRIYSDWVKKAKFLGISTLGICEDNTLAGVVPFQQACEGAGLRSVIGQSVNVRGLDGDYPIKLYVKDRYDWEQLLIINKILTFDNDGFITEEQLLSCCKELIVVLTPHINLDIHYRLYSSIRNLYFQLDFTEWASQDKDREYLQNLQIYIQKYYSKLKPLLLSDAYYLDKHDQHIRRLLNQIGRVNFKNQSKHQYFKSIDDFFVEASELFPVNDRGLDKCYELIVESIENTINVFEEIDFKVLTGKFYLPKYQMTEKESVDHKTNEDLLYSFIEKGLQEKVISKGKPIKPYLERVEEEMRVIKKGGFIDYFLILADIYKYCDENGIWYGIGRGSAAGCLVSYLCDIVDVDPIKFDLIFERFLNEGRIGKSLPDIDCDFQSSQRPKIKTYIEEKYGHDYVTSIGTYGTFKLKNAVKDLGRQKGVPHTLANFITNFFPEPQQQTQQHLSDLVRYTLKNNFEPVREFFQKYPQVIDDLPLLLSQPKNSSIHPAGVVIVPKEYGTIYTQLPVKQQDGLLVSQWEGEYIDEAGFLKVDVLGISQLDKLANISRLIEESEGRRITFKDIPLDDFGVYGMFQQGYTEDVFQFGAAGLKAYCKQLHPDNIEDLIATVAVYRPGPIESGTHIKYIRRKNGDDEIIPPPNCGEITEKTFGLIVYQEQVMQIVQKLANFTLVEADDIRKALGKMKRGLVEGYRDTFMERVLKNGYDKDDMLSLWREMEGFAAYAFNRSHAACYAITGYYCQWFKVNYPLQFWTVSLQYSDDKQKPNRIAEIKNTTNIEISSVDINYSNKDFYMSKANNSIYWALPSIKYVGDSVVDSIIREREKGGQFFSLEEFVTRMKPYTGVNIRALCNLVICGAFDSIEGIKGRVYERYGLLKKLHEFKNRKDIGETYIHYKDYDKYQWMLLQKDLCGYGDIDFRKLADEVELTSSYSPYSSNNDVLSFSIEERNYTNVTVSGVVERLIERNSKKGKFGQLEIRDNTDLLYITIWNEHYSEHKEVLDKSKGRIVVITGHVQMDSYKNQNVVHTFKNSKIKVI